MTKKLATKKFEKMKLAMVQHLCFVPQLICSKAPAVYAHWDVARCAVS
jgi:hypothetical protein